MRSLTVFVAFMIVASGIVGSRVRASEMVEIRLRGHYYSAPATVQLTIAVEPRANNRSLVVEVDGERYFRSSMLTLDGADEKRLHTVEFRSLPAGSYVLRAQLRSSDDVVATASQDLTVTGIEGEK